MQVIVNDISVVATPGGVSIAPEENNHGVNGVEVCVSVDKTKNVLTVNIYHNHGGEPAITHTFDLN